MSRVTGHHLATRRLALAVILGAAAFAIALHLLARLGELEIDVDREVPVLRFGRVRSAPPPPLLPPPPLRSPAPEPVAQPPPLALPSLPDPDPLAVPVLPASPVEVSGLWPAPTLPALDLQVADPGVAPPRPRAAIALLYQPDPEMYYPTAARRRGQEGETEILVEVVPSGAIAGIELGHSTPPGVFEAAARRWARALRFAPHDRAGPVVVPLRLEWRLR